MQLKAAAGEHQKKDPSTALGMTARRNIKDWIPACAGKTGGRGKQDPSASLRMTEKKGKVNIPSS